MYDCNYELAMVMRYDECMTRFDLFLIQKQKDIIIILV